MEISNINNVQPCGFEHMKQRYSQRMTLVTLYPPKPQHKQFLGNLGQLYNKPI